MFMVCLLRKWKIEHQTAERSCILLSRSVISCLQTELTAIVMEDFIHFLQAAAVKICFLDFFMIKKCCGNDVAAFVKLSHVTVITGRNKAFPYFGNLAET